ncbi:MAG TPA: alpha-ketoglutarate-dependent dioxygenase AlkB [Candidatus Binatia bacterium]|nr:alpha-ketoglutarate-dependent dioxygenase AlkB [Candidatus Binatia bacterium]
MGSTRPRRARIVPAMPAGWRTTDEPPPGLRYVPDLLDAAEERPLLAGLAALPFREVVMRGVAARRTVVHFGWDYGYESWTLAPAPPLPPFLHGVRARAAALAGVDPAAFAQVLVARYPPGAGIGWHRDAPMFGPIVVGVSLGGAAVMRFRRGRPGVRVLYRLPLAPRSGYVLAGAARAAWQHGLAPAPALRYSITFRTLARPAAQAKP